MGKLEQASQISIIDIQKIQNSNCPSSSETKASIRGRKLPCALTYSAESAEQIFDKSIMQCPHGNFGGSLAQSKSSAPTVPIKVNNVPGTLIDNSDFQSSLESGNGIKQVSSGSTISIGQDYVVTMKGSYKIM
ncbi:unnamed protein product [Lepeophtheirus salmonis]|uniref:(salmon louse) hypothetical protein n=1 Tax=Lepeophtheirus salmonis TaxID=72036 RepID=A0A7R8CRZ5_LEPSM|nr:unnamed protein product [Lepeophtheirus salmonis]CAF2860473.1 unnamed protein product [Lepeophtheirus salmonis]